MFGTEMSAEVWVFWTMGFPMISGIILIFVGIIGMYKSLPKD